MNKITQSSIESLLQQRGEAMLTIYLPTHRHPIPPYIQEDQTRYKNLIREGRDRWKKAVGSKSANHMYRQLETNIDDLAFWQDTTESMAIFASVDHVEIYHLPIECQEYISVGSSYDVTPLLVTVALNQPYYLLVLAMHNTKLLQGDTYELLPAEIGFPTSPEDALHIDEMFSGSNTVRSPQGGRPGTSDVSQPHGQGDSREAGREERLQYFRIIDSTIAGSPHIDHALPVLVAGTDSEVGDYKALSQLPRVMQTSLQGNYTATPMQDLHALSWPIVNNNVVREETMATLIQFQSLRGTQKSSDNIEEVWNAARTGRVATLLIGMIRITTDSINSVVNTAVPIIGFAEDYEKNQIAQLAQEVAAHGGEIRGVDSELMPEQSMVAAIYRYQEPPSM